MYRIVISASAEKDVRRLPRAMQMRARAAIEGLRQNPRPHGAKKLVSDFHWRLRVGDYRILYEIDDVVRIVKIDRVRHRKEVYR